MSQNNVSDKNVESPPMEVVDQFRLTLDGEDHTVPIASGQSLLEAALAVGVDVPHKCKEGRCITCLSWLRSGDVSMANTKTLSKRNAERGYVLACQAQPSSADPIWLDFDI